MDPDATDRAQRLREVAVLFLKLGVIAFGGPAAHVGLMRQEVVERRRWLSDQAFLDLLGASSLIPGPTSTELAIYIGYSRAGPPGLVLAGVLFIVPAMLLVLAFAWAYVQYGSTPQAGALLYGIKPVIVAVIVQAIYGLLRTAVTSAALAIVVVLTIVMYFAGLNPLVPLFGLATATALIASRGRVTLWNRFQKSIPDGLWRRRRLPIVVLGLAPAASSAAATFSYVTLFLTFLTIGATLYGSGYVLLAFLHDDFVSRLGWLTDQQLLDAIAVGQFTPGPVFTTATFIGYVVGSQAGGPSVGFTAALIATVGIFLPSFLFVAVVYPLVPRLRASPWTSAFLDGANAAAVGLMAAVVWQLGTSSITDVITALLAVAAAVLLIRFHVNSAWLVLGGGAVGLAWSLLRGQ